MPTDHLHRFQAHVCLAFAAVCISGSAFGASLKLDTSRPTLAAADARQQKKQIAAEARQLLSQGKAKAALALLLPKESLHAGDEQYDYLLGTAALDSGEPGLAILALQRVLRINPAFAGAQLELARAYHAHGNIDLAQREFKQLLLLDPPEPVTALISRYLQAEEQREKSSKPSLSLSIAAMSGYDDNANAGIDNSNGFSPLVSDESKETSSAFLGASLSSRLTLPVSPKNRVKIGASGGITDYREASFVNRDHYGAAVAFEHQRQRLLLDTHLRYSQHSVGDDIDFNHTTLGVSAAAEPAAGWLLQLTMDAAELRFSGSLDFRDVDQRTAALSLHRFWGKRGQSTGGSVIAGRDRALNTDDVDWSRRLLGLQLDHFIELSPLWSLNTKLAGLSSQYDDDLFTGGDHRRDITRSASLAFNRESLLCEQCELNVAVRYRNQSSNIGLYRYDGVDITLKLERTF